MALFECNQCKKKVPRAQVLTHLKVEHDFVPSVSERAHEFFYKELKVKEQSGPKRTLRDAGTTVSKVRASLRKHFKSKKDSIKCEICGDEISRSNIPRHFRRAHPTVQVQFEVRGGKLVENLTRRSLLRFYDRETKKADGECECPICLSKIAIKRLKGHLRKSHGHDIDRIREQLKIGEDRGERSEDLFDRGRVYRGGGASPK